MLGTIIRLIKNQKPEYICVCFDQTRNTFRRELYEDYKGQRAASPHPLIEQFSTMEHILEELGFAVIYDHTYEADDWAGSITNKFKNEVSIKLMSKDHDYLQLVDDNVMVWMMLNKDKYEKLKLSLIHIPSPRD